MNASPHTGSQLTITVELAQAAARIAAAHPDGAIRVEYRDDQPENVWHVTAVGVTDEETKEYVVNDETGEIHAIDCDMGEDCMCNPALATKVPKLTASQRRALERCVMNNGWVHTSTAATRSQARKLESYGYVTRNWNGGTMYITDAGRAVVDA